MTMRALACTLLGSLVAVVPARSETPQPVIIQTDVVFGEVFEGTFTATPPLCASGTLAGEREIRNPSPPHAWTVRNDFICDDGSGTFTIQFHPQARDYHPPATSPPEFTVAGPWTLWKGTGDYSQLHGGGDFGVVIDFSQEPWLGEESFVGFLQGK